MRRIAFISDVHANLEALEAVLRDVDAQKPDLLVCLGDTINYGPNPRECLELVDSAADIVLAGNHEKEGALPEPDELEGDARELLDWTVKQLEGLHVWERIRDDLRTRGAEAAQHRLDRLHFVHASASKPFAQYVWPGHPQHHLHLNAQLDTYLVEILSAFDATHSFVGHTHAPSVLTSYEHREVFPIEFEWNRRFTFLGPRAIFYVPEGGRKLEGLHGRKMVMNPGSVGQPRDGNPDASWALYDGDTVDFRRVPYPHAITSGKLRGLPVSEDTRRYFADRLARND